MLPVPLVVSRSDIFVSTPPFGPIIGGLPLLAPKIVTRLLFVLPFAPTWSAELPVPASVVDPRKTKPDPLAPIDTDWLLSPFEFGKQATGSPVEPPWQTL